MEEPHTQLVRRSGIIRHSPSASYWPGKKRLKPARNFMFISARRRFPLMVQWDANHTDFPRGFSIRSQAASKQDHAICREKRKISIYIDTYICIYVYMCVLAVHWEQQLLEGGVPQGCIACLLPSAFPKKNVCTCPHTDMCC